MKQSFFVIWPIILWLLLGEPPIQAQSTTDTMPALATLQTNLDRIASDSLKLDQYADITGKLMNANRNKDAAVLSERALALAQERDRKRAIAFFLSRLGYIKMVESRHPEAIRFYQRAIDVATAARDTNRLIVALIWLAQSYDNTGELALAEKYLLRALQLAARSQSQRLSACYNELAILAGKRKNPRQAIEYGKQSMAISKKNNDTAAYYGTLVNNAITYKNLKQYSQAVRAYQEVLAYAQREKDSYLEMGTYVNLPWALIPMKQLDQAEQYAQLAIRKLKEKGLDNKSAYLEEIYGALTEINRQRGNYRAALDYQTKTSAYHDSIFSADKSRQLLELTTRYETEKKENEIKELNTQNDRKQLQLSYVGGGAVLLLIVLGLVGSLYRRLQRVNHQLAQNNEQLNQTLHELRTTQTQLIQREKMASLGELTAGIAHEIQNPLNFVTNFSELSTELVVELKEEGQKGEKRDEEAEADLLDDLSHNLTKINHHGQRASSIVRSMLEHSRTSTGERQLTNLNSLAEEYLRLAYHGLKAKDKTFNAELVTNFDPALGPVNVVSQDIGRVLINLFNNAFYALSERLKREPTGFKPVVSVSTKRQGGKVEIRILDNGTGISDEVKTKIFQPFFTTKPTGAGTGLGLSLSYDIVTKGHGGVLSVESQEGVGTEFNILLPV